MVDLELQGSFFMLRELLGRYFQFFDSFWLNSSPGLKNDFSAPKKANPGQGEVVTRLLRSFRTPQEVVLQL